MHLRRADRWARERAIYRAKHGLALLGLMGVFGAMAVMAG